MRDLQRKRLWLGSYFGGWDGGRRQLKGLRTGGQVCTCRVSTSFPAWSTEALSPGLVVYELSEGRDSVHRFEEPVPGTNQTLSMGLSYMYI